MIWYQNRFEVLSHAAALTPAEGLVLEFGVASGSTINHLAHTLHKRQVYGFDSFEGLPEAWASYPVAHFACAAPVVPPNVELVVGLFAETLPRFLEAHPDNAALIHIDCDLYASTRLVLGKLTSRIIPGTVIVMDEYFIVTEHEQRAFLEWQTFTGRRCRHEARSIEQLCVTMES